MIREEIRKILEQETGQKNILIEEPREKSHGDYSSNIAMKMSGGKNSLEVAEVIKKNIEGNKLFDRIDIAGPGFINFFISRGALEKELSRILKNKDKFGSLKIGKNKKVNVEFISANPTGPLTLGNGRGGFGGDVLSNVLDLAGYAVTREFYINDHGKQVEDLAKGLYKGEKRTASQIQKANQKLITKDLKIKFDVWFSQKSLDKREIRSILNYLAKKGLTYEKDDALWFRSTKFGDDKDRVLIKEDGKKTYFTSDIAYLKNKFKRGFDQLIMFLGADHHGYANRMKAAVSALGYKKEQLDFIFVQMIRLREGGKEKKMSKRTGFFETLEKLITEVGLDVTRYFFLERGANAHINFDMKLAKEKSQQNPVYYIQYAHARMSSILKKAKMKPSSDFHLLDSNIELDMIKRLIKLEEVVEDTALDYQIQRLPHYAFELAESFHSFYHAKKVITKDKKLTRARLALVLATKIVLKNTLTLMGISAPSKM